MWILSWRSGHHPDLILKYKLKTVFPIEVTIVIFHEHISMTVCEYNFKIGSEFEYHCFRRCMEGFLISYCKHYRHKKKQKNCRMHASS